MSILIDRDTCLACGICEDQCILDNIRVQTPPCTSACPVGINPQAYCTLVSMGRTDEALAMIYEATPFPSILAHVCHAPCEAACTRRLVDESVAIRQLKRYVVEHSKDVSYPGEPGEPTGKRVAVIGAGPAGMIAAVRLRELGHEVVLYDAAKGPGGMVVSSIPRFHMDPEIVERELRVLDVLGVEQRYGVRVGQDVQLEQIRAGHDAVLLAVGTHLGQWLDLEGADALGVYEGLELIKMVRAGERPALGERVVVLGGGNVAVDSARVARRLGAASVQIACPESVENMPAFSKEIAMAREEGITFTSTWAPTRIHVHDGKVRGVELRKCLSVSTVGGVFTAEYDDEVRLVLQADTIVVAVGQSPDLGFLLDPSIRTALEPNALRMRPGAVESSSHGIFCAGDMVRGPSSVVEALASGGQAAARIDLYLRGQDPAFADRRIRTEIPAEPDFSRVDRRPRRGAEGVPVAQRLEGFDLCEECLTPEAAVSEAARCMHCGVAVEYYQECWYCLPCEIECPTQALTLKIPYLVS